MGAMDDSDQPAGQVLPIPQAPDAIELRHLRAFGAVAEELNFSRAAARLYLSQPALSRQIRALERLVGCDLLRRSTHGVELTLAGDALLDRVRRLLREVDDAVAATRAVGGELDGRMAKAWGPVVDLDAGADLPEMRVAYEGLHAQFSPPPEIAVLPVNTGGVPALLVTPRSDQPATVLYLHGGGYVMGSAFGYRPLVGALASAAGAAVLVPEYRLAPEHPFPAALEDALAAYRWVLDRGADPGEVTLAGDSSGGGLVLSVLTSLRRRGLPMPGGAVLFCPWVDLRCERPAGDPAGDPAADPAEPVVGLELLRQHVGYYLGDQPIDDPVVNPLVADLAGFPPLLIQAGTGNILRHDAQRLTDHAVDHGVDARLELYPVTTHVFQIFWSFLPEAADAVQQAGRFIQSIGAATTRARTAPGS
jgi:epsilon-lactone hydrolase